MNSGDVKLDHNFAAASRVAVRYSSQAVTNQPPVFGIAGGPSLGGGPAGTAGNGFYQAQSAAINFTQVFSPSLIGDFRLGVGPKTGVTGGKDGTRPVSGSRGRKVDYAVNGVTMSDARSSNTIGPTLNFIEAFEEFKDVAFPWQLSPKKSLAEQGTNQQPLRTLATTASANP